MLVNLTPLITAFWAWLLPNEQVNSIQLGGIIIAVLVVQ